jgi:hypothetical protein
MRRHIFVFLLCSSATGCAMLDSCWDGVQTCCDDYGDHCCEMDPVQAAMLRSYNMENRAYLCRPFMPLEVVQYTRPYVSPPITNLAGIWGVTPFQPQPPASRAPMIPPAPPADPFAAPTPAPPAADPNLPPAASAASQAPAQ